MIMGTGQPYLVSLASGTSGGDTTLVVQPAPGELWIVRQLYAHHDDAVARDMRWQQFDGTTTVSMPTSGSVAAQIQHAFYQVGVRDPIILTNRVYAQIVCLAMTAGKAVYVWGMVERIRGVETESAL